MKFQLSKGLAHSSMGGSRSSRIGSTRQTGRLSSVWAEASWVEKNTQKFFWGDSA